MSRLRKSLDKMHPLFTKGGKFENFYALYEAIDTFFYSPDDTARSAPHVRDAMDLKRVMIFVWLAVLPCALVACINTGYQANLAMAAEGLTTIDGWRGGFITMLSGLNPSSVWDNFWHGLWYFLPLYAVVFIVGGLWEGIFAGIRNHEINEGFFVTSILFTLTLPPSLPLWMAALGISFGVVIGKEVFGGTGKNFLNPALTGRAFLYFAYGSYMSGSEAWVAVDGYSGATALALAAQDGVAGITSQFTWWQTFFGAVPGSLGETSTLACILGGAFLLWTRVASFRIIFGVFFGMIGTVFVFNLVGGSDNPIYSVPWYWHLTIGGFAFGMIFMATDPVSAAMTDTGRWIYGALIGFMTVIIRGVNPAFPEGIMLAILFANMFAPLIDYGVVKANMKRRQKRTAIDNASTAL